MKKTRKILRMFDFFGESFTFRYKDEDKHSTVLGGLICISFYTIAFVYILINFIPFINNKIFTIQCYTVNSNDNKDEIKLFDDPISFGFELTNENDNSSYDLDLNDLFDISVNFTPRKNADKKPIPLHKCDKIQDFHNLTFKNEPNYEKLKCLDRNKEYTPKGIFTEDEFSYYTISVVSKYRDNETHNKLINDFLIENDCKLQYYYTDIELDLNDKDKPFEAFLNSMFLQLNPTIQ